MDVISHVSHRSLSIKKNRFAVILLHPIYLAAKILMVINNCIMVVMNDVDPEKISLLLNQKNDIFMFFY